MGLFSTVKKLRPLKSEEKERLGTIKTYVNEKRYKLIKKLLKQGKIDIDQKKIKNSFIKEFEMPQIIALTSKVMTEDVNKDIKKQAMKNIYEEFSKKAYEELPKHIAPNIHGMEQAKKAATIQLFSQQLIHILLLGDPGTGKTDILRSLFNLAPISSFGLGSGTTGSGLVVTVKGDRIMKGLLPLADKGVCCIDELNLMKEESRAGLYSAMEKGFVTYDKGGHHYQFDARVKVIATANPKGDKFTGETLEELKKEVPFDSALLTRFHLVFLVRKPDIEQFKKIADQIVAQENTEIKDEDKEFIKEYLGYVSDIKVKDIDKDLQTKIVDFMARLKQSEEQFLIEVSPRLILGFMRLCKGLARMEKREKVTEKDVERIKELILDSLKVE